MSDRVSLWIIAAYLALMTVLALWLPEIALANFFHDDSFFYIKTAQNISDGLGSTYDGINPTNGYHILWMWVLVAISKINTFQGFDGVRPLLIFHAILICCTVALANRVLRHAGVGTSWLAINTALIIAAVGFVDIGVEAPILLLCAWALALVLIETPDKSLHPVRAISLIGLSAVVCLARTDAILFVGPVALMMACGRGYRLASWQAVFTLLGLTVPPAVLTLLAVGLYNTQVYGHFGSISSSLKMHWPGTFATNWFGLSIVGVKARLLLTAGVALVTLVTLAATDFFGILKVRHRSLFVGLSGYTLAYMAALLLLSSGGVASWYFSLSLTITVATLVWFSAVQLDSLPRIAQLRAVALVGLLVISTLYVSRRFTSDFRAPQIEASQWIREYVPENDVIYQVDSSGFTGYLGERALINGDGLINSWDYQRYIAERRIPEYLSDTSVDWVISVVNDGNTAIVDVPDWNGNLIRLGSAPLNRAAFQAGRVSIYTIEALLESDY